MTDKQIVKFILHRAEQNGKQFNISNPELVMIRGVTNRIYLGIKSKDDIFFVRFMNGNQRGIFKINIDDQDTNQWLSMCLSSSPYTTIRYNVDLVPKSIKHLISYNIINALKIRGMGLDAISPLFNKSYSIIGENETYEAASIEADLMCFDDDDELTSL